MILLKLTPNWKYAVTESLVFDTSIYTSDNGKETRQARMSRPRWSFEFTALVGQEETRRITNFFTVNRESEFIFKVPTMSVELTQAKDAFSTLFKCVVPSWLFVGAYVVYDRSVYRVRNIVWNGFNADPVFAVANAIGTTAPLISEDDEALTTEDGAFNLISEGAISQPIDLGGRVHMGMLCRFQPTLELPYASSNIAEPKIKLTASYKYPFRYKNGTAVEYADMKRAPFRVNWRDGVKFTLNSFREVFSSSSGPEVFAWRSDHSSRSWGFTSSFFTNPEVHDFAAFYCDHYGKARGFWFESPTNEIVMVYYGAGFDLLSVEGDLTVADPVSDSTCRVIVIDLADGTKIIREVSGATLITEGGNPRVRLTVLGILPELTAEIVKTRLMFQSRFLEDELSISWRSYDIGEADLGVITYDYEASGNRYIISESNMFLVSEDDETVMTEK